MNSVCVVAVRHQEDPVVVSGIGLAVASDDVFSVKFSIVSFHETRPEFAFLCAPVSGCLPSLSSQRSWQWQQR